MFFDQAADLRLQSNHLLITVHSPFVTISVPNQSENPSMIICTHAARSTCHILRALLARDSNTGQVLVMHGFQACC
jgi:hypothetical protein